MDIEVVKKRFEDKIYYSIDGCWYWTGSLKRHGYGQFIGPAGSIAHRNSYFFYKGPIPNGMHVCHHCDNTQCVNPDHLFIGSRSDNMRDAIGKGRKKPGNPILSTVAVLEIRGSKGVVSGGSLARKFGVSVNTIYSIWQGINWSIGDWKFTLGQPVWAYDRDGYNQFEVKARKVINGHRCYLVNGKYVNENQLKP